MPSFVFNKHTYPTSDVTNCAESAIYILQIFANDSDLLKKREKIRDTNIFVVARKY